MRNSYLSSENHEEEGVKPMSLSSHGQGSAVSNHLEALIAKHTILSQTIDREMKSPAASEIRLRQLKRRKLQLKDEIESLKDVS